MDSSGRVAKCVSSPDMRALIAKYWKNANMRSVPVELLVVSGPRQKWASCKGTTAAFRSVQGERCVST